MSNDLPENSLLDWGRAFFWVGILSGIACIWAALVTTVRGMGWYLVVIGIAAFLQAMFIKMLLQALAEIIILLRRLNSTGTDIIPLLRKIDNK
jgi:hypothetical protein